MLDQFLIFLWVLSVFAAGMAGWGVSWASGFLRGVRWERQNQINADGRRAERQGDA